MPLNSNQIAFLRRVERDDVRPVFLVEIGLHRFLNGQHSTITHRESSEPFQSSPTDTPAFEEWLGNIQSIGASQRSVLDALIERGETSIGIATIGSVSLYNDDRELDTIFGPPALQGTVQNGGYSPHNQTVTYYLTGGLRYADRIVTGSGVGQDAILTDVGCQVTVQSGLKFLDRTMVTNTLQKTSFPNLPDATEGTTKPEAWGTVYNAEPILVDPTTSLYFVACRGRNILAARIGGLDIAPGGWQQLNDERGLMISLAVSTAGFKLTVDFEGSPFVNEVWNSQYGDIVKDILDRHAADAVINTAGLTQLQTDRPYDVGIYFREPVTIREALRQLSRGMHVFFVEDRFGEINMGALEKAEDGGAAVLTIDDDVSLTSAAAFQTRNVPPIYGVEVQYRQLETLQDEGQLSSLFTGIPDIYNDLLEYYKRGYQVLPFEENAAELANDMAATLGPYRTRITNAFHARALKNKIFALRGETTNVTQITLDARAYQLRIHDVIELERRRMNLLQAKKYRVMGIQDNGKMSTLELWG